MAFDFGSLSPEVKAAIIQGALGMGAGVLGGVAQGKQDEASRRFQLQQQLSNNIGGFRAEDQAGAQSVLNGTRMGEIPATYASLALRRAMLNGAPDNANDLGGVTAPSGIPQGKVNLNFDLAPSKAAANQYLSDDMLRADLERRLSAEGRVDPNGATFDMGSMFGTAGGDSMQRVQGLKDATAGQWDASRNAQQAALQQALQGEQGAQSQGGGKKGFFGKLLAGAAPFLSFIPGVGVPLSIAAGAIGGGMAGGASGALMGGAGAYLGGRGLSGGRAAPNVATPGAVNPLNPNTFRNLRF